MASLQPTASVAAAADTLVECGAKRARSASPMRAGDCVPDAALDENRKKLAESHARIAESRKRMDEHRQKIAEHRRQIFETYKEMLVLESRKVTDAAALDMVAVAVSEQAGKLAQVLAAAATTTAQPVEAGKVLMKAHERVGFLCEPRVCQPLGDFTAPKKVYEVRTGVPDAEEVLVACDVDFYTENEIDRAMFDTMSEAQACLDKLRARCPDTFRNAAVSVRFLGDHLPETLLEALVERTKRQKTESLVQTGHEQVQAQ